MTNSLSRFGPWLLVAYGLFTMWMPLWYAMRRGATVANAYVGVGLIAVITGLILSEFAARIAKLERR